MKIGFITDTNILKKNERELNRSSSFINNIDFFIEYIDALEKTSSNKQLIYFMPNIIMEELYYQKLQAFQLRYKSFYETYKDLSYGLSGELPISKIEDIISQEKEEYKKKVKMLELPYNEEVFKELIEDALKKKPPFDKSVDGHKTDAGYKDALIWKTIVYSKEIDECKKLYFFSGDKIFKENEVELTNEFKKQHPDVELSIIFYEPDGNQRQKSLQFIINENNLLKTEVIKLYDLDLMLKHIKSIQFSYNEEVSYYDEDEKNILKDVLFKNFSERDFEIENVEEISGKYEAIISFCTEKYTIANKEDNKLNNKKKIEGKIEILFIKVEKDFKLESYKLHDIKFQSNLTDLFGKIRKAFMELCTPKLDEIIQSTMSESLLNLKNIIIQIPTPHIQNDNDVKMLEEKKSEEINKVKKTKRSSSQKNKKLNGI